MLARLLSCWNDPWSTRNVPSIASIELVRKESVRSANTLVSRSARSCTPEDRSCMSHVVALEASATHRAGVWRASSTEHGRQLEQDCSGRTAVSRCCLLMSPAAASCSNPARAVTIPYEIVWATRLVSNGRMWRRARMWKLHAFATAATCTFIESVESRWTPRILIWSLTTISVPPNAIRTSASLRLESCCLVPNAIASVLLAFSSRPLTRNQRVTSSTQLISCVWSAGDLTVV